MFNKINQFGQIWVRLSGLGEEITAFTTRLDRGEGEGWVPYHYKSGTEGFPITIVRGDLGICVVVFFNCGRRFLADRLSLLRNYLDVVERSALLAVGSSFDSDFVARAKREAGDSAPRGRIGVGLERGQVQTIVRGPCVHGLIVDGNAEL